MEGGETRRRGREGGELARKAEVESCHATGPEGCLKRLDLSLHTHTHKHTTRNASRHTLSANSIFKSCFSLNRENQANKINTLSEEC